MTLDKVSCEVQVSDGNNNTGKVLSVHLLLHLRFVCFLMPNCCGEVRLDEISCSAISFYADYTWVCHQENNFSLPFMCIFLDCRVVCSLYWIFSFYIPSAGLVCKTTFNFCQSYVQMNSTSSVSVLSALMILSFLFSRSLYIFILVNVD